MSESQVSCWNPHIKGVNNKLMTDIDPGTVGQNVRDVDIGPLSEAKLLTLVLCEACLRYQLPLRYSSCSVSMSLTAWLRAATAVTR
jgi:hypothetical protein